MRAETMHVDVGAVIVSTGYALFPADAKPQYGYGSYRNVITGAQMERLLAPTRPYNTVLRPSDGKVPERIAYVMCTGSRDQTVGNPLCSKFCCMYSIKQNQLIMGVLPLADVTVHYIDIRAVGKGYDEFFEQAKAMGANFVKGRVAGITETAEQNLVLRYEDIDNGGVIAEAEYDLVVLAVGVLPNRDACSPVQGRRARARRLRLRRRGRRGYQSGPHEHPRRVRRRRRVRPEGHPGVDPSRRRGRRAGGRPHRPQEGEHMSERRIGVYVCHCGGNISDYVDVDEVIDAIEHDPGVVVARSTMFTCSDATQQEIEGDIREQQLDGLVVASCSPKLHTFTFREVARRAGLNPYEYTQVNIREQCSWTHTDDRDGATRKAISLVRAGIARTRLTEPLEATTVKTTPRALVIGGGVAGMRAAIGLADLGLAVFLVERAAAARRTGGRARHALPARQQAAARWSPACAGRSASAPTSRSSPNAEVTAKAGTFGNYRAVIHAGEESIHVEVGQIVVATGVRQL